ncbi:MAG: RNA polymerase sigma factor, partial [Chitinophagaceae bacterium]
ANINQLTDHLFRHESGKMVAVLTKIFGTENLDLAEDVVQETFLTAVQVWSLKGLPENTSAWLMRVAKNKAIDVIRKNKFSKQIDFSDPERKLLQSEYTLATQIEKLWQEDDLLRMMYACCHHEITVENQITLILKTLCGFSTAEIAKAFFTSEDTISKRLYRTKEFFRDKKIKPEFPVTTQLKGRTEAVLKTIYLIFNEGYNSTHSNELIRKDLLQQAMYLCKLLCNNSNTQLPEVYAAMALMCFHASRIDSRISSDGEIILLAQQDRSKWDWKLIEEGNEYLNKAAFGDSLNSYHVEAAIAFEHCIASSFEKTNWQQILAHYDLLVRIHPTAIIALNRLTVVYKIKGAEETLKELNQSPYLKEWKNQYLYYSLLGEIYTQTDKRKAMENFEKAIRLTHSEAERKLLKKKMENL